MRLSLLFLLLNSSATLLQYLQVVKRWSNLPISDSVSAVSGTYKVIIHECVYLFVPSPLTQNLMKQLGLLKIHVI